MFRLIFHDWDDESTVRILRAVQTAAGKADVTLLIVEVVSRPLSWSSLNFLLSTSRRGQLFLPLRIPAEQETAELVCPPGWQRVHSHPRQEATSFKI